MTDDPRRADEPATGETPWWARPSSDAWSAPPLPDEQRGVGWPDAPAVTADGGESGDPYARLDADTEVIAPPRDPWALTDTLGEEPKDPRRRPRTALLVGLLAVASLLAGVAGGAVGFLLADRDEGSVTVDGSNLGSAPPRSTQRPEGSIASVAADVLPSVVQIKVGTDEGGQTGSGFVVDDEGLVVTNNHVVAAASNGVTVSFADGTDADAEVVGTSASYDLAVLRVDATNLPALPLGNSDAVVVGDPVVAIGSPLGLSGTVTSGIVSAKNRPVTAGRDNDDSAYINAIQTDAAINPGNSGGPLVNLDGEVIGVNSAIATVGGLLGEGGNIGVGFAIPINQVRRTVEQIIETGEAQFPIIGASLDGRFEGEGARIATTTSSTGAPPIVPDGPADQAGLEPGDVIVAIDGEAVEGSAELIVAIRSHRPGDTITLTVRRGGNQRDYRVTLAATEG
ncbi:MAG TPA: trypsin-like peptidase domain-containing protein [Actinomycetes bacterium]